jgi:HEAT repeat protein
MARTNHPNSVRLLRFYLQLPEDPEAQKAAGDALVDLGSEDARFAVVEALSKEKDARARARLLDVLGRFDGVVVEEWLQRALDDPAPEVQAVAAIRAGEKGLRAAVPGLIALLRGKGTDGERDRALTLLEELTCQRIAATGYGEKADAYDAWWATAKAGTDRTWFREALVARGYDTGSLLLYVKGDSSPTAVPLLLRVLRDEDPSLRTGAERALGRITGRTFGPVGRGVPPAQAARVAQAWSDWWASEGRAAAGPR